MKHRAYGRIERDVMQLAILLYVLQMLLLLLVQYVSSFNRPDLNIGVKSFVIHILSFTVHLDSYVCSYVAKIGNVIM